MYRQQLDRMNAPALGYSWSEFWSDTKNIVSSGASKALDIYAGSRTSDTYRTLLTEQSKAAAAKAKYLIIGGFALGALYLLTKER